MADIETLVRFPIRDLITKTIKFITANRTRGYTIINAETRELAKSPTGNIYIDNGQEELLKIFDESLSPEEQRDITKQTYIGMYLNAFPDKSDEEAEQVVENALCNIEKKNLINASTETLKRVDGLSGDAKDKYPLVKQIEERDYLIAGRKVKEYHTCQQCLSEQEGQDIILPRKFLPSDIRESINYRRAIFCRSGKLGEIHESYMNLREEEEKYCLVIPSEPAGKSLEDKFVRYLKEIEKNPKYNESDFRNDFLTRYFPNDFVIGRVRNLKNVNEIDLLK
ncbi:MAG: hypothetical protein ABFQ65_01730 [Nanoarchaeota archaeon]